MPSASIRFALAVVMLGAATGRASAQADPADCRPVVLNGTVLGCEATGTARQQLRTGTFIAGSVAVGQTLAQALGVEVATAPIGSSSGGFTWTWDAERRSWSRTSRTFGPAFGERALTIGKRKLSAGINYLHRNYDTVDGLDLDKFGVFQFQGGSLAASVSTLELEIQTDTVATFAHYGVLDTLDVGILVPYVRISIDGTARIFGQVDEELQRVSIGSSASGIGDVAIFGKYRLWRAGGRNGSAQDVDAPVRDAGVALGVTMRLPTGDEDELLGLGTGRVLVSLIASAVTGRFSPHINVGYDFWTSSVDTPQDFLGTSTLAIKDQVVYSGGVEYQQSPRLTLLFDVLGRYQRGGGQVGYQPFRFPPNRTNVFGAEALVAVPGGFNTVLVAPGMKWNVYRQMLVGANVLIAATDGGLRDRVTPVIGVDVGF